MKTRTKIKRLGLLGAGVAMVFAGFMRLPGGLEGRYDTMHEIAIHGVQPLPGDDVPMDTVNDRLIITRDTGRSFAFDIELIGNGYSVCKIEGVARFRPRNPFRDEKVFRFSGVPPDSYSPAPCVLDLIVLTERIQLKIQSEHALCSSYCGPLVALDWGDFDRKTRVRLAD